jgi:hypothetical protein
MPKGPRGEKRPADVIGAAVMVAKIATGEIEERRPPEKRCPWEARRREGRKGARQEPPASLPAAGRLNDLVIVPFGVDQVQFPCPFPAKRGASPGRL